ncbi:MAG: methyltransferase domain-containing protein [Eubacteriales bacterium]
MSNLLSAIHGYSALPLAQKKEQLSIILEQKNILSELFSFIESDLTEKSVRRSASSVLCDAANKEKFKKKIFTTLSPDLAAQLLADEDPKLRKNIAKLIGTANQKRYARVLIDALQAEQTEFVLESLILALGYTDYSKDAYKFLLAYTPKATEDKHRIKEEMALQKALSSLKKAEPIDDVGLKDTAVILTYPAETPDALKDELKSYKIPFSAYPALKNALSVKVDHLTDVFVSRCFFEALVDLDSYPFDNEHNYLKSILNRIHKLLNKDEYQIRFDLRYLNPPEKKAAMEALVLSIRDTAFSSSPSNYQLELRLIYAKDAVNAYMVIPSLDTRFAYRKETIPASIHPVIAANMMRTLSPYLSADATVLDPFCGTGTLLYERDTILPCEELIGVDIKKDTIYKAKVNFLHEDVPIGFLVSDILTADLDQTFDEVIANMPFGHRVSDTKQNKSLYAGFIAQLKTLLKVKGYAFLYTNQKQTLVNLVKGDMSFSLVDEILFEAGGLYPSLFIVQRIR